jgi:hypothetical protein
MGYHPIQKPSDIEEGLRELSKHEEIRRILDPVYAGVLLSSKGESAPSIVWRSDLQFLGNVLGIDEPRWATRFHLWESLSECVQARYVGFVNSRPEQITSMIAEGKLGIIADAYLAPPARMVYPPYHLTVMGTYSRIYGVEPFACVPFSKPYKIFGSLCAQASIFVALVICTRIGAHAIGTFEVTSIANPGKRDFQVEGLTVQQISDVFKDKSVTLNSFLEIFRDVDESRSDLKSCINGIILGYLETGLPVILNVDYNKLYGTKVPKPAHCIVLIGYKCGKGLDPACYIYNDSAKGPFMEEESSSLLNAAIDKDASLKFVVPVPREVVYSLMEIPQLHEKFAHKIKEAAVFKYSLASDKVLRQYSISPATETSAEKDEKIDQTLDQFLDPHLTLLQSKIPKYVWVKEFYDSIEDMTLGHCSAFALFDATSELGKTEEPFILFFDGESLTLRKTDSSIWLFAKRKIKVKRIPVVA